MVPRHFIATFLMLGAMVLPCLSPTQPKALPPADSLVWLVRQVENADTLFANPSWQQRMRVYEATGQPKPWVARYWLAVGDIRRQEGKWDQAKQAFHRASNLAVQGQSPPLTAQAQIWLGECYRRLQEYGTAEEQVALRGDSLARVYGLDTLLARSQMLLGNHHYAQGDYQDALTNYREARQYYQQLKDSTQVAWTYNNQGACYFAMSFYSLASTYYFQALRGFEALANQNEMALTLYNLGLLFELQKEYDQALHYYQQSGDLYAELGLPLDAADLDQRLAEVLIRQGKYHEAHRLIKQVAKVYETSAAGDYRKSTLYHAWGKVLEGLNRYTEAYQKYDHSRALKASISDPYGLGQLHNSYAATLFEGGSLAASYAHYDTARQIALDYGNVELLRNTALGFAEVLEAQGHTEQAYGWYKEYKSLEDSLFQLDQARQVAELREQYESEKKDQRIHGLESDMAIADLELQRNEALIARQRARQIALLLGVGVLALLAIGTWVYFRNRRKREVVQHNTRVDGLLKQQESLAMQSIIEGQEQERKRLARELHDHFGSLLATVKVNLNALPAADVDKHQRVVELVDQACHDIRSLSHSLHVGLADQFGLVSALQALANALNDSGKLKMELTTTLKPETLDAPQEIAIYRAVQELVSNVLKHAHATKVSVSVTGFADMVNIMVEDNGRGFDPTQARAKSDGLGLKGLQERVEALQGEFSIDSHPGKGTTIVIDVPLNTNTDA